MGKYTLPEKRYEPIVYKGRKNETILPEFVDICKKTQMELINWLPQMLMAQGYEPICDSGYIYAKGTVPVLLTAHMDTVHKETVKDFYENEKDGNHILSSPQGIGGDDRCGIYMILEIIKTHKCSVLFCEDEEIGALGSKEFCKTKFILELSELNYLIELDRTGKDDAVFYDCDNPEFTKFITENTGYIESWGSFSDISILSPMCATASVNFSCGYYKPHTLAEEVVIEEMLNTIEVVKKLLDVESKHFKYIEANYGYNYYGYNRYNNGVYYGKNYSSYNKNETISQLLLVAYAENDEYYAVGKNTDEAWRKLFINNPTLCYNDVKDYEYCDYNY